MNTSNIKSYAPKARNDFIAAISKQAAKYGITEKEIQPAEVKGDFLMIGERAFPKAILKPRSALVQLVEQKGFDIVIEQEAYSWFNRLCAIRYMELHDYLGHGRRVLSHSTDATGYQILEECLDIDLPGLDQKLVRELKLDGNKDEELYRELLVAQCHALHTAMPFLFEPVDDETELLLPENLTKTDSLIHDLTTEIPEQDWDNIEIIGWLYQFYISVKKDQVIGKVVKSEDIPAATQLFTPNWIVKYMVQNSLGAQWLASYSDSPLKEQMEYYIEPAEQTDEVNAQLKAITPESLNPEELTLIDPASGSGHILVEAYDLFKAIYLERGYRQRDIAQLILEKNLFGLDIDQRAAQLTGFALMMKGREDDRRLFERGVKLNVMAMVDSTSLDIDTLVHGIDLSQYVLTESATQGLTAEDLTALKDLFEHATTFGSLIQVPQNLAEKLPALKQLSETSSQDMFVKEVLEHLAPLVKQAEILAAQYDAVVANPPFVDSRYHCKVLKDFIALNFRAYKKNLFSAFVFRCFSLSKPTGMNSYVTPFVWLFIDSYNELRKCVIGSYSIHSLVKPSYTSFFESAIVQLVTFVIDKRVDNFNGTYFDLGYLSAAKAQPDILSSGIKDKDCVYRYNSTSASFRMIPGSPIAFSAGKRMREVFKEGDALSDDIPVRLGMATGCNDIYLRLWHEVCFSRCGLNLSDRESALSSMAKWFPYSKGGTFRRWYGNLEYVVNWENDGQVLQETQDPTGSRIWAHNFNLEFIFKPSVTWSFIADSYFGVRYSPGGALFDVGGSSAFPSVNEHLLITGFLCSKQVYELMKIMNPTVNFQVGNVASLPLLRDKIQSQKDKIKTIVLELIEASKFDWDGYERSWDFQFPLFMNNPLDQKLLEHNYVYWAAHNKKIIKNIKCLEEENNRLFINAYGLQEELTPEVPIEQITLTVNPAYRYGVKGTEEERNTRFREDTMAELVCYAIGCMMGRYSLDEPGLIYANSGNEGFDDLVERGAYTKFPADDDGIIPLTDKEWFTDDAANRLVEFISVAWDAAHLEQNLDYLAANLSPKKGEDSRDTIRRYLCDKFFKDHMQTYKKRPIYWLFSSGKQKAFQCLVYLHRYNEGTLARMRTEYVIPLTSKMTAYAQKLENDKDASSSAAEIKRIEKELTQLHKQQAELSEFDEKLRHYADQRISLDLDDGVKVNYGKFGDLLTEVKAITGKKPE